MRELAHVITVVGFHHHDERGKRQAVIRIRQHRPEPADPIDRDKGNVGARTLRNAIDLGFRAIVVFTNGVKTARASYVDEILDLGAARGFTGFEWRFSIQGGDEAAHDHVTQKPGSFARLVAGMRHLRARGQDLTANACINEHSYRSLPGYVDIVREHGIRQLHLDQVRPRDAGQRSDDELRAMMPRYTAMVPYFRAMLDRFDRELGPDHDINVGNLPFCVMPERAAKIHHDGEPTQTVAADGDQLSRPWDKYADKRSDKLHPPACARCVFRPRCNGIFDKYAQLHGVDEFTPVLAPAPRPRVAPDPPAMKYRTLPGTTLQLSAIGLRCRPGDALADTVAAAIDLGVDWLTLTDLDLADQLLKVLGPRRHRDHHGGDDREGPEFHASAQMQPKRSVRLPPCQPSPVASARSVSRAR